MGLSPFTSSSARPSVLPMNFLSPLLLVLLLFVSAPALALAAPTPSCSVSFEPPPRTYRAVKKDIGRAIRGRYWWLGWVVFGLVLVVFAWLLGPVVLWFFSVGTVALLAWPLARHYRRVLRRMF